MKKKNLFTLFGSICLVLVLVALLIPGCAKEAPPAPAPTPPKPAPPAPTPEKVTWKLQSVFPPPEEIAPGTGIVGAYGFAMRLSRAVEKASNGNFKIEIYVPGALFPAKAIFDALSTGAIEMSYNCGTYCSGKVVEGDLESLIPGLCLTYEQAKKMMWETEWLEIIRRNYAKYNVYFLGDCVHPPHSLISSFPCYKVSDLKGKKMRASAIEAKAMKCVGAVPIMIAPAEIYTALQRGTIDGVVYPAYCGISYKFFEVAKYAVYPGVASPTLCGFRANMDAYNKLPREYKDILDEEVRRVCDWSADVDCPALDRYIREYSEKDFGVTNIDWTPEVQGDYRKMLSPIWDEFRAKSSDCAKLLDLGLEAKRF